MSQTTFTNQAILELEKHFKTNFINSLSGFKSGNLIGTVNKAGLTNLSVFTSVVHLGANPPLMGMISRPHSVPRHTLENILATKYFTINHIQSSFYKKAHQTSARYDISEFEGTGLTEDFKDFKAPFVKEAAIQIGLELVEVVDIPINNTKLIIGKIIEVHLPEDIIGQDGKLDIEAANKIALSGLDTYHSTKKIARLSYAKPNQELREIE
jgi:flavin reductase (DIM6/NTAB) family NADH-FMN oxidoreductase RutF